MRRGFGWVDRVLRREEMVNCFGVESLFGLMSCFVLVVCVL